MSTDNFFLRTITDRRTSLVFFVIFAGIVATVAFVVSGLVTTVQQPDLLAAAIAIDLLITVPLAFYFLVFKRYGLSLPAFAPVIGAGWLIAYLVLPVGHRSPLLIAEAGAVAFEVAIVVWITRKAWRAAKMPGPAMADPLSNLRRIAGETIGNRWLGSVAGTELAVFYYSLFSWFSRPRVPEGTRGFSYHRKSGQVAATSVLLFLILAETLVVHLVVSIWSVPAAWVITVLSVYGGLWILGDLRASVLRPVVTSPDLVLFKAGLRYDVGIPLAMVESCVLSKPEEGPVVSAALFGEPTHWIVLNDVLRTEGVLGFRTDFRAVGFSPDDPGRFEKEMDRILQLKEGAAN